MKRRNLLKHSIFFASAFAMNPKFKVLAQKTMQNKLNKLKKGDTIAVVAPSSNATSFEDEYKAKEILDYFGLKAVFYNQVATMGLKTREEKIRANELNKAFADDNINGIWAIRGGYGAIGILDKLDYDLIAQNPKPLMGYSDITALHIAIHQKCNFPTFHSPVLLSNFNQYTTNYFTKALFYDEAIGLIEPMSSVQGARVSNPLVVLNSGVAEGKLTGGNLSLIASLIGTPFQIETKDKILFLEDVGEAPYKIERMLYQLKFAGIFDNCRGVIVGKCDDCNASSSSVWDRSELDVWKTILADYSFPVIYGYNFGHTSSQITIPIGMTAKLDTENLRFEILESPFI